MTNEEFYEDTYPDILGVKEELSNFCQQIYEAGCNDNDRNPIEHYKVRMKSAKSMENKLIRLELPVNKDSALTGLRDIVGARIVCTFLNGVERIAEQIKQEFHVINEKDYIRQVKPNGYRSLHLILCFQAGEKGRKQDIYAEIQLRTIAMDCWASLEHQLKYKQSIPNQSLIVEELKRCADELASADLTMQTIFDMISKDAFKGEEKRDEITVSGR